MIKVFILTNTTTNRVLIDYCVNCDNSKIMDIYKHDKANPLLYHDINQDIFDLVVLHKLNNLSIAEKLVRKYIRIYNSDLNGYNKNTKFLL